MAGKVKIQIIVHAQIDFNAARLKKMLIALCERFAVRRGEISIVIVDDNTIKKVNKEFLGRTSVTDVISFDLSDNKTDHAYELIINARLAERQAKKLRHNPEAELVLYVIHGFLHNVGYNDAKRADAHRMHKMEDEILQEFGYGITFAHNTSEIIAKRG